MPARNAARRRTWRSTSPPKPLGRPPTCAYRRTAASGLRKSSTSSASFARRGSTQLRRSRPILFFRTLPSMCLACRGRIEMGLPLDGLLVVSLEQAVAAPMCTCRLADAGARVIKIERPEGDFARGYDSAVHGESAYFVWLNRGKESVVLDLALPADKTLFAAMIAKADVLVQNLKPGAVEKLGFAIARLRREHPRLIGCSISGYGEEGPYAGRKAYD